MTKYLIRPDDHAIFFQKENERFQHQEHPDSIRDYDENLLVELGFYPAVVEDFPEIQEKQKLYSEWQIWASRSDGHGGRKGGTMKEFLAYKKFNEEDLVKSSDKTQNRPYMKAEKGGKY
jgi:hypothetical protein